MPRLIEMGTVTERCQRRADLEGDGHISAAEWLALISEQYGELFSLVAETGLRYFETTSTLTTTGAAYVSEPANHLATIRIDYLVDGTTTGKRRTLDELMPQEQAPFSGQSSTGEAYYYALVVTGSTSTRRLRAGRATRSCSSRSPRTCPGTRVTSVSMAWSPARGQWY